MYAEYVSQFRSVGEPEVTMILDSRWIGGPWRQLQSYMEPCFTYDHEKSNCGSFVAALLWMTSVFE